MLSCVSTLALPWTQTAPSSAPAGSCQSPARELHDAGQHRIDHDRAGEAGAARIVNPHHIAVFVPPLLGIGRARSNRPLAPCRRPGHAAGCGMSRSAPRFGRLKAKSSSILLVAAFEACKDGSPGKELLTEGASEDGSTAVPGNQTAGTPLSAGTRVWLSRGRRRCRPGRAVPKGSEFSLRSVVESAGRNPGVADVSSLAEPAGGEGS